MTSLPKSYDPKEAEARWQQAWEEKRVYAWDDTQPRENSFVIDTPPPTVSGLLHMGHIFSYTQADFVARYQRMNGKTVFYPMGFDDNGLPTERLVEKVKKIRATDMSREDFIKQCESVAEEARIEFRRLFTSVALSVDWAQEYHTISDDARRISQLSFLDLFRKERAYRKLQPMLWDPVDQTAIAQAEIVDRELESSMSEIEFAVARDELRGTSEDDARNSQLATRNSLIIATTRPELIPACVAVFYHPEDARYQHLKGKYAVTPLFGVRVPILEDDTVEMEKGTGIMMCCTFGDEADIAKWEKHNLPMRVVLNKYGKMDFTPPPNPPPHAGEGQGGGAALALQGLKAEKAREKMLELLAETGALKESKKITHAVKCAERSGAPLEILPTHQWFVRVLDQKEELKAKAAECNWRPEYMKIRMDQWIDGLKWDWCISRQRYFGVPFPVWYKESGELRGTSCEIIVARPEDLPVNPLVDLPHGYTAIERLEGGPVRVLETATGKEATLIPEADVMDTWATSSVSPQISSRGVAKGAVLDEARHAKLFPADLRPQAHEIIRTWAFYTIVKAHLHENTIPWKNLMISGWCLASDKTKMSKSKGNVVTPVELIQDKGADAVRYWASTSRLGADTAFSEDVLKIGRKLVTKLWNASQFVAMQLAKLPHAPTATAHEDVESGVITETLDRWILSRLQQTVVTATSEFERFEYCEARVAIEEFFWKDFCDNYLELVKARAYGGEESSEFGVQSSVSALHTLHHCLNALLRLFAPFVPHVTEEIYSHLFADEYARSGSLHARGNWPDGGDYPYDAEAERAGIACVSVLNAVRKAKSERNVSIKYPLTEIVLSPGDAKGAFATLQGALADLKAAANAGAISWRDTPHDSGMASEDGLYTLDIAFAAESDVA